MFYLLYNTFLEFGENVDFFIFVMYNIIRDVLYNLRRIYGI